MSVSIIFEECTKQDFRKTNVILQWWNSLTASFKRRCVNGWQKHEQMVSTAGHQDNGSQCLWNTVSMTRIKRKDNKSPLVCGNIRSLIHDWWDYTWYAPFDQQLDRSSQGWKLQLDPAVLVRGMHSRDVKTHSHRTHTWMRIAASFIDPRWKHLEWPQVHKSMSMSYL